MRVVILILTLVAISPVSAKPPRLILIHNATRAPLAYYTHLGRTSNAQTQQLEPGRYHIFSDQEEIACSYGQPPRSLTLQAGVLYAFHSEGPGSYRVVATPFQDRHTQPPREQTQDLQRQLEQLRASTKTHEGQAFSS